MTAVDRATPRTRFQLIREALDRRDDRHVLELARAIREEYVAVHDGLVDAIAAALSCGIDVTSPEEGEAIARRAMERHIDRGAGTYAVPFTTPHGERLDLLKERIRGIAEVWHWHPGGVTVSEDDDRVTFHTHPCGSGMRLELRGKYGPGGWHRSASPSGSNFMQEGFPTYCNHCADLNRMSLTSRSTTWLVEGWRPHRDPATRACRQHSYKRFDDIPSEFFDRAGLSAPRSRKGGSVAGRLFTDDELSVLARHPSDLLVDALGAGRIEEAKALADAMESGWTTLRGSYPAWLSVVLAEIVERAGADALPGVLEQVLPELVASVGDSSPESWAAFWSMQMNLRAIETQQQAWVFTVGVEAFVDREVYPGLLDGFFDALDRGVAGRNWSSVGTFEWAGDVFRHRLPVHHDLPAGRQ